ncbi:unnamed protein product [Cunninghamella blakesleeana]
MATMNTQSPPRAGTPSSVNQDDNQLPHLLSLKVMRLSRPLFSTHSPIYYEKDKEKKTSLVEGLEAINISDLSIAHPFQIDNNNSNNNNNHGLVNIRDFGLSQMLKLPSSFGTIYLGEGFHTFISLNNETVHSEIIREIGIKVELQTSSQRFSLYDTLKQPPPQMMLEPNKTHDITVSHEIKELGVHILVCSVFYTTPDGKKRNFRKFYKFQVSNPLAVKTKLNNLSDGRVCMEAQIQNVSQGPMFLERMKFEPSDYFHFNDLNYHLSSSSSSSNNNNNNNSSIEEIEKNESKSSIFDDAFIHPQDIRQYLYMLTPKSSNKDKIARTTNALGKLDIVWRSSMGDMGRLQTSQLTRKVPILDDIEVQPISAKVYMNQENDQINPVTTTDKILLETPFILKLKIYNHSAQNMNLLLSINKAKMGSVLLSGTSTYSLGELGPSDALETQLEFFPLTPGLQRVGGLRIKDLTSDYTKDIDHLCDVFVLTNTEEL